MMYTEKEGLSGEVFIVKNYQDGSQTWIPTDPANSDYQAYLRWLENPDADEVGGIQ